MYLHTNVSSFLSIYMHRRVPLLQESLVLSPGDWIRVVSVLPGCLALKERRKNPKDKTEKERPLPAWACRETEICTDRQRPASAEREEWATGRVCSAFTCGADVYDTTRADLTLALPKLRLHKDYKENTRNFFCLFLLPFLSRLSSCPSFVARCSPNLCGRDEGGGRAQCVVCTFSSLLSVFLFRFLSAFSVSWRSRLTTLRRVERARAHGNSKRSPRCLRDGRED